MDLLPVQCKPFQPAPPVAKRAGQTRLPPTWPPLFGHRLPPARKGMGLHTNSGAAKHPPMSSRTNPGHQCTTPGTPRTASSAATHTSVDPTTATSIQTRRNEQLALCAIATGRGPPPRRRGSSPMGKSPHGRATMEPPRRPTAASTTHPLAKPSSHPGHLTGTCTSQRARLAHPRNRPTAQFAPSWGDPTRRHPCSPQLGSELVHAVEWLHPCQRPGITVARILGRAHSIPNCDTRGTMATATTRCKPPTNKPTTPGNPHPSDTAPPFTPGQRTSASPTHPKQPQQLGQQWHHQFQQL